MTMPGVEVNNSGGVTLVAGGEGAACRVIVRAGAGRPRSWARAAGIHGSPLFRWRKQLCEDVGSASTSRAAFRRRVVIQEASEGYSRSFMILPFPVVETTLRRILVQLSIDGASNATGGGPPPSWQRPCPREE